MLSTILGTLDKSWNKIHKVFCPHGADILIETNKNKHQIDLISNFTVSLKMKGSLEEKNPAR